VFLFSTLCLIVLCFIRKCIKVRVEQDKHLLLTAPEWIPNRCRIFVIILKYWPLFLEETHSLHFKFKTSYPMWNFYKLSGFSNDHILGHILISAKDWGYLRLTFIIAYLISNMWGTEPQKLEIKTYICQQQ